jgi:hypothetical protein
MIIELESLEVIMNTGKDPVKILEIPHWADTWPVDAIPGEDPNGAFDIHNLMQTVHGIWYIENLDYLSYLSQFYSILACI